VNQRIQRRRDALIDATTHLCAERAGLLTESWQETAGMPIIWRRALGLAHVLDKMTVTIYPGELIVGHHARPLVASSVFPEFGLDWLERELDELSDRRLDPFFVSPETSEELQPLFSFWEGKSYARRVRSETLLTLPAAALPAWDSHNAVLNQAVSNSSSVSSGEGHVIVNFPRLIASGINAILAEIDAEMAEAQARVSDRKAARKVLFLKSSRTVLEAAIRFAARYAAEARRLAADETDPARREELLQVAANCEHVPAQPARTFWEVLQSTWLLQLLIQIESNGHSIGPGRLDQFAHPVYAREIASGALTTVSATELIQCYIMKCNEIRKARQWSSTRAMHGYPMFQTVTLGGQRSDGRDATNDLTYHLLEAMAGAKMQEPTFIVRLHSASPPQLEVAACRAVVEHGGGFPGFFNDEVTIPLLTNIGVSLEDARNWVVCGCSEPEVPGKHNTITSGACHVNLLKILEIALHDGENPATGITVFPGCGGLADFQSYDDLVAAYRHQLDSYLAIIPVLDHVTAGAHTDLTPTPFVSAFIDGRIEIGKDATEGGPPNYQNNITVAHGSTNVGNSLFSIKKLVFEDQLFSGADLLHALDTNFAGEEGRRIRKLLLDAPKFGNDETDVDGVTARAMDWFCDGIAAHTPPRGGHYCPSPTTLSANAYTGEAVGATPDGRLAADPTADNVSPMAGTDLNGATATMKSVARLDHEKATNGTILNIKLHPTAVKGGDRLRKFAALVHGFFDLKGMQVQFNVVDADILRDAQANPENHRNLIVKVAGYSALFTNLDAALQDQIIQRTEHAL
jgi:pyruvate formate-lyase/glycerol dehydratase family glycyl radical enzyme